MARTSYTAPPGHVCLAVGPSCWGVGPNPGVASRRARAERPSFRSPGRIEVWVVPTGSWIDDMGDLRAGAHNPRECDACLVPSKGSKPVHSATR